MSHLPAWPEESFEVRSHLCRRNRRSSFLRELQGRRLRRAVGGGAKAFVTLLSETQAAAALHMVQEIFELAPDEANGRRSILR
jgi:hypothetical protein